MLIWGLGGNNPLLLHLVSPWLIGWGLEASEVLLAHMFGPWVGNTPTWGLALQGLLGVSV